MAIDEVQEWFIMDKRDRELWSAVVGAALDTRGL